MLEEIYSIYHYGFSWIWLGYLLLERMKDYFFVRYKNIKQYIYQI